MSSALCGISIRGCKHMPKGTAMLIPDGLVREFRVVVKGGRVVGRFSKRSQKQFDERVVVLKGLLAARKESADA